MSEMTLGDIGALQSRIEQNGFVTAMEPACGAGSMVIALTEAMRARCINYQRHPRVTAVDIDPRAVHMAYAQLSLLHAPAQIMVALPVGRGSGALVRAVGSRLYSSRCHRTLSDRDRRGQREGGWRMAERPIGRLQSNPHRRLPP